MKPLIAQVVFGLPVEGPFDYSISSALSDRIRVGYRVSVLFNRQIRMGFIVGFKQESQFKKLNPIIEILDNYPVFTSSYLEFAGEMSDYFACSRGEALETMLPAYLRKKKGVDNLFEYVENIDAQYAPRCCLIHDLYTDELWKHLASQIDQVIQKKQTIILLVPDALQIDLVIRQLQDYISASIVKLDKKLTQKKEFELWNQIRSGEISVVIGTRSAIFSPMVALGLIIIFDEHHTSYKQEQTPHYHVHELAMIRSKIEHCDVTFISSTPSVEIWHKAKKDKWNVINFDQKQMGSIQIIDMSNYNPRKSSIISIPLRNCITEALQENKKIVLFINKKGFGRVTRCTQCGFTIKCKRCDTNMIYLFSKNKLICSHCNNQEELPEICPSCNSSYMRSMGMGMEKIEVEMNKAFPNARIACFDQDSKKFPDQADVVIATQALFQQRHQKRFDVIAVIDFDTQLYHMDFRSTHKAFALLMELRLLSKDKVLVQTRLRDTECLQDAVKGDFKKFYRKELSLRKELEFPPFKKLVTVLIRGKDEEQVLKHSQKLFEAISKTNLKGVDILDPHTDVVPKLRDQYRYVILLKGQKIKNILKSVKNAVKKVRSGKNIVTINVDY